MESLNYLIEELKKDILDYKIVTKAGVICIKVLRMKWPIDADAIDIVLCDEEKEIYMNLKSAKRKREVFFGKFLAKIAVFEFNGLQNYRLNEICIVKGIFHNPLITGKITNCTVSISHSKDYVAVVAFPKILMIGLDMEMLDNKDRKDIYFNSCGREYDMMPLSLEKEFYSYIVWTCKEALGKCLNLGLNVNYTIYEIKRVESYKTGYRTTFVNFPELIAYTKVIGGYLISIVYPKKIEIGNETSGDYYI